MQNPTAWIEKAVREDFDKAAVEVRARRDRLLELTDRDMCLDRLGLQLPTGTSFTAWLTFLKTLGEAVSGQAAKYRQALREVPQQEGFPYDVTWPEI